MMFRPQVGQPGRPGMAFGGAPVPAAGRAPMPMGQRAAAPAPAPFMVGGAGRGLAPAPAMSVAMPAPGRPAGPAFAPAGVLPAAPYVQQSARPAMPSAAAPAATPALQPMYGLQASAVGKYNPRPAATPAPAAPMVMAAPTMLQAAPAAAAQMAFMAQAAMASQSSNYIPSYVRPLTGTQQLVTNGTVGALSYTPLQATSLQLPEATTLNVVGVTPMSVNYQPSLQPATTAVMAGTGPMVMEAYRAGPTEFVEVITPEARVVEVIPASRPVVTMQAQPARETMKLQVAVIRAVGLNHVNFTGEAPRVKCYFNDERNPNRKMVKFDTRPGKGHNPIWNETFELDNWAVGDGVSFSIADRSVNGLQVEGQMAAVLSEQFHPNGIEAELPINGLEQAFLAVRIVPLVPGLDVPPPPFFEEAAPAVDAADQQAFEEEQLLLQQQEQRLQQEQQRLQQEQQMLQQQEQLRLAEQQQLQQQQQQQQQAALAAEEAARQQQAAAEAAAAAAAQQQQQQHHEQQPAHQAETELPPYNGPDAGVPMQVRVHIVKAVGLQHLNHFTGDNPWCKVKVIHGDPHGAVIEAETQPSKKTLDPVWDETFEMDWVVGAALEFSVFDQGLMGSKTEGKATLLTTENFYPNGIEAELPIEGLEHAFIHVSVTPVSNQEAPLNTEGAKLQVSIIQASGLQHMNFTGDQPWVQCVVLHKEHKGEPVHCKTKPVKGLEPVWNETFELDWQVGEDVEFTVFDKGMLTSKEEGQPTTLFSDQFWPNGLEGDLPIAGIENAFLNIRVVPILSQPATVKQQIGDWLICEDGQGEFYSHAPSGQMYNEPPPELLALLDQNK
eukprot:TRINITY_DN7162_c0_g2_i5.p1 TRINITY_DN7162_c0_g2~~TRINITY_DN7162_c0_g2_i5.p1  ORF type:complete len:836 (+),score=289.73 TRINITY_DN7162_c0_g2_i5:90-2597(+)